MSSMCFLSGYVATADGHGDAPLNRIKILQHWARSSAECSLGLRPYLMMRMPWDSFRARSRSGWLLWYRLREPCCAGRKGQVSAALAEAGRGLVLTTRPGRALTARWRRRGPEEASAVGLMKTSVGTFPLPFKSCESCVTLGSNLTICLPESRFCNYFWVSWGELGEMTIPANVYWLLYVRCFILIPQQVCEDRLFYFLFENCGVERLSQGPGPCTQIAPVTQQTYSASIV